MILPPEIEAPPFFSICIPQYSRVKHLIYALNELQDSSCKDFEVCISDDVSSEPEYEELRLWLAQSSLVYCLHRREISGRYDKNLRTALGLAKGQYLLLMGNDDCFQNRDSLALIKKKIEANNFPEIVIPNYQDFSNHQVVKRIHHEQLHTGGIDDAKALYRSFAFVSGLVLKRNLFESYDSDCWDGTEMYQIGVGCAAILDGARTLTMVDAVIRKDIVVFGQAVDSYQNRPPKDAGWQIPLETTLTSLPVVLLEAFNVSKKIQPVDKHDGWMRCARGLYLYTFPYWIYNYKSAFGFKAAYRLFHTLKADAVASKNNHAKPANNLVSAYYLVAGLAILALPCKVFEWLRPLAYRIAKSAN